MSESAEVRTVEVMSANLDLSRSVSVEITNHITVYDLNHPNGVCDSPPRPNVRPHKTEVCSFSRTGTFSGAVGVLTYDLIKKQCSSTKEKLAIIFSVPFDRMQYKNWVAIGIYADDKECDEALYKEMYYDDPIYTPEKHGFVRQEAEDGGLTFMGSSMDIKATMSPEGQSMMKVDVWDKPRDD